MRQRNTNRVEPSVTNRFSGKPIDPDSRSVLRAIHQVLDAKDWTFINLAQRIRMPRSTMFALLHPESSGYGPLKITVIRRIAEGLNVPIHKLLADLPDRLKH